MLCAEGIEFFPAAVRWFVGAGIMLHWLRERLVEIRLEQGRTEPRGAKTRLIRPNPLAKPPASHLQRASVALAAPITAAPDLTRQDASFNVQVEIVNTQAIVLDGAETDRRWFRLRSELNRLSLFEGFDELLCLPALRGVEIHWYQVETVRKVLKQYRGRVLLADEVGLGKTIEAGMILKEYALRGMAERILILTPAALVGQWRDEMQSKFGIDCVTSHDSLLRTDPAQFWAQPRVIASIAAARRKEHAELLAAMSYDAVVVDEAHHLRDQSSASYRLVNSLQKRFLLLLSATPVQNSLVELYNLLTLLKPGIFRTQKDFRSVYMTPGKPREPANRERLRDLMRGVMVRNTRALAALRLPRRHASTLRTAPGEEEAGCYRDLSGTGARGRTRCTARRGGAASARRGWFVTRCRGCGSGPFRCTSSRRYTMGCAARSLPHRHHRRKADDTALIARAEPGREEDGVRPPSRFHGASRGSAASPGNAFRAV